MADLPSDYEVERVLAILRSDRVEMFDVEVVAAVIEGLRDALREAIDAARGESSESVAGDQGDEGAGGE